MTAPEKPPEARPAIIREFDAGEWTFQIRASGELRIISPYATVALSRDSTRRLAALLISTP